MIYLTTSYGDKPYFNAIDIKVYQIVIETNIKNTYEIMFRSQTIKVNERYNNSLKKEKEWIYPSNTTILQKYYVINNSLHSFASFMDARNAMEFLKNFQYKRVADKLHIIECIIPENGKYYIGEYRYASLRNAINYASSIIIYNKLLVN